MDLDKLSQYLPLIYKFNEERGWKPVPQDIAKSIVLESAELLEHFQWDGGKTDGIEGKNLTDIKHEVADIFWYLTIFCQATGIDLADAIEIKYHHNQTKYPKEKFSSGHNQEFYLAQKKKYRQNKSK